MPRENRKRGKKHKKLSAVAGSQECIPLPDGKVAPEPEAGPSWITRAPGNAALDEREAPFGYVDSEVKAYFRTVDVQIREWQNQWADPEDGAGSDPNEDRRLFFMAALNEMSGKEKQLATDPDCSGILERMSYSMDDFARRVFVDQLSGSYEQLLKHRFASHVCQTLLTVAGETINRECRGIYPSSDDSIDTGDLRTLSQLTLDICEEILPIFPSLILDPFASHVLRALLSLLMPKLLAQPPGISQSTSLIRSKKSAAFKAKQGPLKSVFTSSERDQAPSGPALRPQGFSVCARGFVTVVRRKLDENEVRALAANKVASPVLQMLLEVEAEETIADEPGSLMDSVLVGLISTLHEDKDANPDASDYVGTLMRDPTSSHLLETLVSRCPDNVFNVLWTTYFQSKLGRLAVHPVANFVVAKTFMRLSVTQLQGACGELNGVAGKILKSSRIGVLRALVERASILRQEEGTVLETIHCAFDLRQGDDRNDLVDCVLRLLPSHEYNALKSGEGMKDSEQLSSRKSQKTQVDPFEPKTQGALLLQSLLLLSAPYNQAIIDSLFTRDLDGFLAMSRHVTSSRIFDTLLDAPAVPIKAKRQFVLKFMGQFHALADDRIGSRVADRCWTYADPYLKEKIGRSLMPHEQFLAASFYGKFFARRLNLQLLRKDTEKWKNLQSTSKPPPVASSKTIRVEATDSSVAESSTVFPGKRKRGDYLEDEIDKLFDTTLGRRIKRAELAVVDDAGETLKTDKVKEERKIVVDTNRDRTLDDIMGAIKTAPKSEGRPGGKKKRVK